jgi:hypothetical protein
VAGVATTVSFTTTAVAGPASVISKITTDPTNIVAGDKADARRVEISLIGAARPGSTGDRR